MGHDGLAHHLKTLSGPAIWHARRQSADVFGYDMIWYVSSLFTESEMIPSKPSSDPILAMSSIETETVGR